MCFSSGGDSDSLGVGCFFHRFGFAGLRPFKFCERFAKVMIDCRNWQGGYLVGFLVRLKEVPWSVVEDGGHLVRELCKEIDDGLVVLVVADIMLRNEATCCSWQKLAKRNS